MQTEMTESTVFEKDYQGSQDPEEAAKILGKPLISIVVATKGNERAMLLERCLRSLQKQTFRDFEIILIYSTFPNGLAEFFEECNILALKETSKTLGAARNLGVKNAKGAIVVFIDDDAEAPEDWLVKIYLTFQKYPSVMCLGGSFLTPPEEDKKSALKFVVGSFTDSLMSQNISLDRSAVGKIAGCNVAYKKEIFQKVGYINEKYRSGEDWDFSMRLVENGCHVRFDPNISVWHHRGDLKHTFWNNTRMGPFYLSRKTLKYARYESSFAQFYLSNIVFFALIIILAISPFIFVLVLCFSLLGYFMFAVTRTKVKSWRIIYYPLIVLYTLTRLAGFYYGLLKSMKSALSFKRSRSKVA
jgi:GT2 family glycosyltransferase